MKKVVSFIAVFFLTVAMIFLQGCSQRQIRNAGLCGAGGAIAGVYLNKKNPQKGALIGLGAGALACAAITAMAEEAAREAAVTGRPAVRYGSRGQMVRSEPVGYNAQTKCRKIVNTAWNNGKEVGRTEEEICEGQKVTSTY